MNKADILAHVAVDEQSRLTLARVLDKAEYTRLRSVPAHSQFLTDGEQILADQALTAAKCERYSFWGGYPTAERKICVFLPDWAEEMDEEPLAAVEVTAPQGAKLSHRDYLGGRDGSGAHPGGGGGPAGGPGPLSGGVFKIHPAHPVDPVGRGGEVDRAGPGDTAD